MSDNWYYMDGEERKGPFDIDAMKQLLRAGVIQPGTWVAKQDDEDWTPAELVLATDAAPVPTPSSNEEHGTGGSGHNEPPYEESVLKRRQMILFGAFPLVLYFLINLLVCYNVFIVTNDTPDNLVFAWHVVGFNLAFLMVMAALPAFGISRVQHIKWTSSITGKPTPEWTLRALPVIWIILIGIVLWIAFGAEFPKYSVRLTGLALAKVATSGVFNFYGFLFIVVIVASTFAAEKSRRHLKSAREKQQAPPIHAFIAKNLAITASLLTLLTIIQCALVYAVRGPDSSSDSGAVDTAPSLAPSSGNTDPAAISTTRRTVELVARAIDIWHCKYGGGLAQHWQKVDRGDFNPGAPSPPPDLPRTDVIGEMTSNLDLILEDFLPGDLQCRMVQDEWNRNLRVLIDGDGDGRLALGGTTVEARAIVWSMGSDGIDNQGSGDDVVALLNWPQGVPPNDPAVYQTIVPPSLANAKTLLFKGPLDMPFANIGNPGNPADPATAAPGTTTGRYGTVSRDYRIAVFETTIAQYATFLNAVGATDEYGLYSTDMHTDTRIAGIIRQGQPGSFVYYVIADSEHKPITYVSWFDAARFSNWMHNGQPAGTQTAATTEDGAYTLNGLTSGLPPARKPGARFWIPDINEWHKAAYYDPTKAGTGGYWRFPMRCDTLTSNTIGATNAANYFDGDFLGSGNNYYPTANALTVVGTYGAASNSSYGTADQGGNVWEWTDGVDRTGNGSTDGLRGGSWFETDPASRMSSSSSFPTYIYPIEELARAGFRVAGAPESK